MTKSELVKELIENAYLAKSERLKAKQDLLLDIARKAVKQFQVERLKITHKDLLISPDTSKATNFFLRELYGTKDLSQRDKDLEKLIPMMDKLFPNNLLEVITNAIILDALTEVIDNKMAKKLGSTFTEEQYFEAYKIETTKDNRLKQIDLTESLGLSLANLINLPFISSSLKIMAIPAKLANLSDMHNFLSEGFTTFREMKSPQKFVKDLTQKERTILEEIYK